MCIQYLKENWMLNEMLKWDFYEMLCELYILKFILVLFFASSEF